MTIDERLEALTQSLELTAGLQRGTDINVSRLSDAMTRLSENQAKFNENQAKLNENQAKLEENHAKLEESHAKLEESHAKTEKMLRGFGRFAMAIAHDHEKRLFDVENPET